MLLKWLLGESSLGKKEKSMLIVWSLRHGLRKTQPTPLFLKCGPFHGTLSQHVQLKPTTEPEQKDAR